MRHFGTAATSAPRNILFSAAAMLMLGTSHVALASAASGQPAAETPAAEPATTDESDDTNVVVTARNRVERLQEVPLAITSLSAEDLSRSNVRNLRDIAYLTPGLSITSGGSEFGVNPVIRGQTNLNGGAGDPNVAVFIDGIYISNNTAINLGLMDIARVEIVKGPVSALYGHNAFAGAINYVSRRPSADAVHGSVQAFVGNDQQYSVQGRVSFPLVTDVLAIGVAGNYEHFGGSYQDRVNGLRAGGFEKRDAQVSLNFTPSSAFSAYANYYYGNDTFAPSALTYNANNCGVLTNPRPATNPNAVAFSAFCGHYDPIAHPVEVAPTPSLSGASGNDRTVNLASLNLRYDFGPVSITSLTGFAQVQQQRFTDFEGRRDGIPFVLSNGSVMNLQELFGSNTNTRDFSQELRLQSSPDHPFRWQIGGFYYKGRTFSSTLIGVDGTPIPPGVTVTGGFGQAIDYTSVGGAISQRRITQARSHDEQYSGFIGAEYDILQGLTLSGEYRYTHQRKDQLIIRNTGCPSTLVAPTATCQGPAPTPYLFPNGTTPASGTFNYSNYRGTVRYEPMPGINLYASVANGTKAGGFNQRATTPADLQFAPERNTTFEIGIKNSLFNNRLQLNIAAFHIDTSGIQISGPSSDPNNPGLVTKNFGSVNTDGFEIELAARVAPGVRINAGVGYANPRFGSDAYDYGAGAACLTIPACSSRVIVAAPGTPLNPSTAPGNTNKTILRLDGLSVPRETNLQLTGGIDLDGAIGSGGWRWNATANVRYESRQFAFNNNISWYGPRTVVNVRAGVANDRYNVSLYANNLTNDQTPEIVSVNARLSDFGGDLNGYAPVGRQYGITAGVRF